MIILLIEANEAELEEISRARRLSLNLTEMQIIQDYFRQAGYEPRDIELETIAQTWSEHCVHKTLNAKIVYEDPDGTIEIDSLLDTYIKSATDKINKPWVKSAFVDNAGIVAFDAQYDLALKVETHNHPSAIDPFNGAHTGIGGVIRDILGVSARPIANTDILCFGPHDLTLLPDGVLHPIDIFEGVTKGIEDYGNKMGIPTVNGAILYDPGYVTNPLVFCGCLGILPCNSHPSDPQPGDLIIAIGGKTGLEGLRGATFSSMEMTGITDSQAIQTGDPIYEKQILEVVLAARDEALYTAINDCGGGGLSSAIGEMAAELGADVYLDRVSLKNAYMHPWEIWLSESQERMVLAVHPFDMQRLQEICDNLDVEMAELGKLTNSGQLNLYFENSLVAQIDNDFLYGGLPQRHLNAIWKPTAACEPDLSPLDDLTADLLAILTMPNIRSKEDVVRRYDHEVQGGTVVKPFVGVASSGPGDAAVIRPLGTKGKRGVALSVGINPHYGLIDPYAMAWAAIDESIRNCVAVGADPDQVAILDNFCWGNPDNPETLGELVRCAQGCYDAAIAYGVPFISGKDSLNNESNIDGKRHVIPGTLLISALGIVPDIAKTLTTDLKQPGNLLYAVGQTRNELGGSAYYQLLGISGANVPQPPIHGKLLFSELHSLISSGLVQSCHDCSDGGLLVAAAEMALGGGLGLELDLGRVLVNERTATNVAVAFSESLGRFLVEVRPKDVKVFEYVLAVYESSAQIGHVRIDEKFIAIGTKGETIIETDLEAINKAWRGHI